MEVESTFITRSEAPSKVRSDAPNRDATTAGLIAECAANSDDGCHTQCHVIDHVQCICCYGQNLSYIRSRNISRQDASRRTTPSGAYDQILK